MSNKYTEIVRLHEMLTKAHIPHSFSLYLGGYHLVYSHGGEQICSVIQHDYSYGASKNLLEIMGLLTPAEAIQDSVVGNLTADDVFNRIFSAWRSYRIAECTILGAGGEEWKGSAPSWD